MTSASREWLPFDVSADGAARGLLHKPVSDWLARWCPTSDWTTRWSDAAHPSQPIAGLPVGIPVNGVTIRRAAPAGKLAAIALMLPTDWAGESAAEQRLIDAFEHRMVDDLSAIMRDRLLPSRIQQADQPAVLWLVIDDVAGGELIRLGFAHDLLVDLAKSRLPAPRPRRTIASVARAAAVERATVTVALGSAKLSLAELFDLSLGDVVVLDRGPRAALDLRVGGEIAFRGQIVGDDDATTTIKILN